MPYIKPQEAKPFREILELLPFIETKGQLEYCIFKIMKSYMENKAIRYSNLHDTVYAAMHCADEFRRRFLDKREDEAIKENGDVY